VAKNTKCPTFTDLFCAVIFVNIFLSFIILTQKILVVIGFLFWVDFDDNEDIGNCRLKQIIKKNRIRFFWGKHFAENKNTTGNARERACGKTE